MQGQRVWLASLMSMAMLLAACGGDSSGPVNSGGSTSNTSSTGTPTTTVPVSPPPAPSTQQPSAQAACRPNGKFTYAGSASQVATNNGQLAVVVVPSLPSAYSKNRNMTAPNVPASSLVQQASGAFTTVASSAAASDCLGMDHGAVTEIQSVGTDVAIGRWNQAMDTDGNTYNEVQGVHYAVGTPLTLTATSGTMACTVVASDAVSRDNGTGATGTLGTSTATLDLATHTLNNLTLPIVMDNVLTTRTFSGAQLNSMSQVVGQFSVQSVVVGHDATQPLVAIGYSGLGIAGVVVLSCK